jgi:hypothetical protein
MTPELQELLRLLRRKWQEIGDEIYDHCRSNVYAVEVTMDRLYSDLTPEQAKLLSLKGPKYFARHLKLK